jgi:hypothetical protein
MRPLRLDLDAPRAESFGTDVAGADAHAEVPAYDRSCILSCPLAC